MSEIYDIAIIGNGPAGISAAITATVRRKNVLLLGSNAGSDKLAKAEKINNYPGYYGVSGTELKKAFDDHIAAMGIEVTEGKVSSIFDMGGYFSIAAGSEVMDAKAVILAGGVSFGKPIDGESELLGRGVSYCATCDGMLYSGRKAAVIAYDRAEAAEADFLASIGVKVDLVKMYKGDAGVTGDMEIIEGAFPEKIEGDKFVSALVLKDGTKLEEDAVFILRSSIAPDKLISGLELDGSHIKVDRKMKTNIAGLFAAGDITGTPYQFVKAAGEGNVAALSAVKYLDEIGRK